jgi:uncharacterized protein (DUF1697 family)
MKTCIALVRAINVGGRNCVGMEALRQFVTDLGLAEVRSLLQSGNLVFQTKLRTEAEVERLLEAEAKERLGFQTNFFVRTAEQWTEIIDSNPFPKEAKQDPARLIVFFLKRPATADTIAALQAAITGPEIIRAKGNQAYISYPDGMGRSRLTIAVLEKKLGSGTARNWNTVMKLAAMASQEVK